MTFLLSILVVSAVLNDAILILVLLLPSTKLLSKPSVLSKPILTKPPPLELIHEYALFLLTILLLF